MLSEEFNIEGHVVVVKKRLAEGGFGYIDLVTDSRTNAEYCLKRCGIQNTESQEIVNLEIKILRDFRCENIVQMIGSEMKVISSHRKEAFILLEYCSGGHLLDILNRKAGSYLKISVIGDVFSQVLKAVKALHDNNPTVTHRDLKLENILKARNGTIKLCDFGSCVFGNVPLTSALERSQAEDVIGKTTTQSYRAPEMVDLFMREELTEKTDIWALGCILYTLCFISHPFQDAGNLGILSAKVTMPEADSIPETARTLITMMLDMDPEARPNVDYLLSATTAITHGTALPSYSLSGEARQRKLEREQAATRRQVLMDKKSKKSAVPTRAPVQLDPNSAAARRLAAKRGGGQPTSSLRTTPPSSTNDLDFGNFGNFEKPAPVASSAQSTSDSTADSSQVFATNFDADFADVTPIQSATQTTASVNDMFFSDPGNDNDDGFGDGVTISAAVVSSDTANDMFFTESSPTEEDSSNHRNDGFSNFDDDDDRFPSTFTAPEVTVSSDSFFDNVATEEQHSPFKVDDGFGVSGTDYGFSNLTVNEDAKHSPSQDFFSTETSANNTQQDFLFGHDEDTTAKENRTDFDFFGTTEEHHSSHSQAASFQPPQNDPFDMFTESPAPPSSSNGSHAAIDDIFSLSNEPNPTASKAANVMQMFNNVPSKNDDPFADVQPQHHQQRRGSGYNMSQQSGYNGYQQQQPSGYGGQPQRQHQNQQYGGGGVRQMNPPGGQRDPFGSLMGSLK